MMRRTKQSLVILMAAASLLGGCVSTPVSFKTGEVATIDRSGGRMVTGKACGFQLLLVIPININERQERAYEALRIRAGNAVVADVEVQESWFYGFVGTGYCTTLRAKAYPRV